MSKAWYNRLVLGAALAVAAALCALGAFVPAVAHFFALAQWPIGVFTGAVVGWKSRGWSPDGHLRLTDKLALLILAAIAGDLLIPWPWNEVNAAVWLGATAWLVWRYRRTR